MIRRVLCPAKFLSLHIPYCLKILKINLEVIFGSELHVTIAVHIDCEYKSTKTKLSISYHSVQNSLKDVRVEINICVIGCPKQLL